MQIIDELKVDIDWRLSQLATIKTIPLRYTMQLEHKDFLIKYLIPSIYAIWEGFVKNTFSLYVRFINSKNLDYTQINSNILTHAIGSNDKLKLDNPRKSFSSQFEHTNHYVTYISQPILIGSKIPTKSNVDFNVINEILNRFALDLLNKEYESNLNNLVFFRNSIAHGENNLPVKQKNVTDFTLLVNDLMSELLLRIESGIKQEKYMN